MKNLSILGIFTLLVCLFSNCESDTEAPLIAADFFPLEVGRSWEYKVDSLKIAGDGNNNVETSSFIRETIVDRIDDDSNNPKFLYEKAWKRNVEDEYQVLSLFSLRNLDGNILRTENNLEIINIMSPIVVNECWDGLLFDERIELSTAAGDAIEPFKAWNFKVLQISGTETIEGETYDDVITVQQADDENAIELRFSQEKYQRGVGMIQRVQNIANTQCFVPDPCADDPWMSKAEVGFFAVTNLIAFN